ncbi:unnamed protein product [Prunus armeniaca]|uniref:Uncharacterized protein n=2 Tax=Prunus armeniaca TaxID=36596 RepID=A0A6J5WIX1_PRUAR|nr:unnamed protein product [Prunus armeniaca]
MDYATPSTTSSALLFLYDKGKPILSLGLFGASGGAMYHKCEHPRGVPRHGATRRPICRQNLDHRDTPFIIPPHTFCTPSSPTTHMDIPDLAWFKVLLLVAKHSSEDLYSMAGTCKLFEEMLNDPEVRQTVSVEKYQWHPEWYGFYQENLLSSCKSARNTTIQKSFTEKLMRLSTTSECRLRQGIWNPPTLLAC